MRHKSKAPALRRTGTTQSLPPYKTQSSAQISHPINCLVNISSIMPDYDCNPNLLHFDTSLMILINSTELGDKREYLLCFIDLQQLNCSSTALFSYGSNNASALGTLFIDLTYKHAYDLPLDSLSFINDLAVLFSPGSIAVKGS